jgi:hypothetical protein
MASSINEFVERAKQIADQKEQQMNAPLRAFANQIYQQKKQYEENKRNIDYTAQQYGLDTTGIANLYDVDPNVAMSVLNKQYTEKQAQAKSEQSAAKLQESRDYQTKKSEYDTTIGWIEKGYVPDPKLSFTENAYKAGKYFDAKKAGEVKPTAEEKNTVKFKKSLRQLNGALDSDGSIVIKSGKNTMRVAPDGTKTVLFTDGTWREFSEVKKAYTTEDENNPTRTVTLPGFDKFAQMAKNADYLHSLSMRSELDLPEPIQKQTQQTGNLPMPEKGSVADNNMKQAQSVRVSNTAKPEEIESLNKSVIDLSSGKKSTRLDNIKESPVPVVKKTTTQEPKPKTKEQIAKEKIERTKKAWKNVFSGNVTELIKP